MHNSGDLRACVLLELAIMTKDAAVSAMHGRWGGGAEDRADSEEEDEYRRDKEGE